MEASLASITHPVVASVLTLTMYLLTGNIISMPLILALLMEWIRNLALVL